MKVLTNIIRFILTMMLVISMISIGIISIISSTILNKEYTLQKLEEANFYEETYKLVISNFENYIYQSGLDEQVLEDICSKEKVEQDIKIMISNIYDGTNQKIDTTEIAQNLNNNIEQTGIKNKNNEKSIEQFVTQICTEYTDTLIHTQYEGKINEYLVKIVSLADKIYSGLRIFIIVDIILIIIVSIKQIAKSIQAIGIALLSTGIFNLIINAIITSKVNIQGIKVFNDAFSNIVVTIINDVLSQIVKFGVVTLIISIIFIIIYSIIVFAKTAKSDNIEQGTEV